MITTSSAGSLEESGEFVRVRTLPCREFADGILLASNPFQGFGFAESFGLVGFLGVVFAYVRLGFGGLYWGTECRFGIFRIGQVSISRFLIGDEYRKLLCVCVCV